MPFNINTFKSDGLIFQGARPSLFEVEMFSPFSTSNERRMSMFIQAATLPESVIEHIEVPYFGRRIKVFGDRVFQNWQVQVLNDEDFPVRAILEKWHNEINSIIGNKMSTNAFPSNYKQTANVKQYNKTGDVIRQYTFEGLFPTEVQAIGLNWGAGNEIESFSAAFAYDYWVPTNESSSSDQYKQLVDDQPNALRDVLPNTNQT